jgi:prepilin-type processing-associated H-X9-DG protein
MKSAAEVFRCPMADPERNDGYDYAFNLAVSGKSRDEIEELAATVMTFDADGGRVAWRHHEGANFGYVDGHVKWQRRPAAPVKGGPAVAIPAGVQAAPLGR